MRTSAIVALLLVYLCGICHGGDILVISCYQKSPIISLRGLAEELVDRGHRVRFAVTDDDIHLLEQSVGVEILSSGPPPDNVAPALDAPALFTGEAQYADVMIPVLLAKLQEDTPDIIICDSLSFIGEALGEALDVPTVQAGGHLVNLMLLDTCNTDPTLPPLILGASQSELMESVLLRIKRDILAKVFEYVLPLVKGLLQNPSRHAVGLPSIFSERHNDYGRSKLIISGSSLGVTDYAQSLPPLMHVVGPFLPRRSSLHVDISQWLESSKVPVVYVSIGTNSEWTQELVDTLLAAFESDRGKYRVLWAVKEHFQHMLQVEHNADDVHLRIEAFVDQLALLQQPQVRVFLTHSGLSSALESVWSGTAMLAMPMMLDSDQPTIAHRLEEINVARVIDRRYQKVQPCCVSDLIEELLTSETIEANVARYSKYVRRQQGAKRAADIIEDVLECGYDQIMINPMLSAPWYIRYGYDVFVIELIVVSVLLLAIRQCIISRDSKN